MSRITIETKELEKMIDMSTEKSVEKLIDDKLETIGCSLQEMKTNQEKTNNDIKKTLDRLVLILLGDDDINGVGLKREHDVLWREHLEKEVQWKMFKAAMAVLGVTNFVSFIGMIMLLIDLKNRMGW